MAVVCLVVVLVLLFRSASTFSGTSGNTSPHSALIKPADDGPVVSQEKTARQIRAESAWLKIASALDQIAK